MKAVFVGRFQPFHRGHRRVIDDYRGEFDSFSVAMGSAATSRTADNPLTAEERAEIIHACFPGIDIVTLVDEGKDEDGNRRWARKLERETGADVVLSQNDLVQRLVREYTEMELVEQELYDPGRFSGTEIRRRIRNGEEWRDRVPDCAADTIEPHLATIRETGP